MCFRPHWSPLEDMSQNIDCLRQVFAGQAHTLTFPGLLLEPNMISRPANNRYWGQSLHSVSITKSLVFMRARRAREHLYLRSVSCNCTPRCAKWAVTRQEHSGLCWLDSDFSCHHSSLSSGPHVSCSYLVTLVTESKFTYFHKTFEKWFG